MLVTAWPGPVWHKLPGRLAAGEWDLWPKGTLGVQPLPINAEGWRRLPSAGRDLGAAEHWPAVDISSPQEGSPPPLTLERCRAKPQQ